MAGRSELPDESTNVKWMYEGANSSIDREQYLLGKRISKMPEEKGDFIVENSTNSNLSVSVLERLDYESKVREDPLFSIRKKEDEKRRELLSNPIKRKRLQSALKNAIIKDLSSKRSSKQMSGRRHSSSSSDTDSSSDSSSDERSKELIRNANKDKKLHSALKKALEKDLGSRRTHDLSDGSSKDEPRLARHHKRKKKSHSKKHKKKKASEDESRDGSVNEKSNSRKEGYGLIVVKPREKQDGQRRRPRAALPVKEKYVRKERSGFTRKLTKEELEKKRKEMMNNAEWRDDQRRNNVRSYTEEEKKEKEREEKIKRCYDEKIKRDGKVKTFLHDMKVKQTSIGSLEDTIRRKRHTLERSSGE